VEGWCDHLVLRAAHRSRRGRVSQRRGRRAWVSGQSRFGGSLGLGRRCESQGVGGEWCRACWEVFNWVR